EYLDNTVLHQFASGTITDKNQLLASVKKAHEDGYTISYSELEDHTTAIAAPIFNHKGNVIGGLSIAGIEANYTEDNITTYEQKVIKAANNISTNLGNIQYSKNSYVHPFILDNVTFLIRNLHQNSLDTSKFTL